MYTVRYVQVTSPLHTRDAPRVDDGTHQDAPRGRTCRESHNISELSKRIIGGTLRRDASAAEARRAAGRPADLHPPDAQFRDERMTRKLAAI